MRRPADSITQTAAPTRTCAPSAHVGAAHSTDSTWGACKPTTPASTSTSAYGTRTSDAAPTDERDVSTFTSLALGSRAAHE